MVLTTPGIPANSQSFEVLFKGSGKLIEKQTILLYSWKTPEKLYKQPKPAEAFDSRLYFLFLQTQFQLLLLWQKLLVLMSFLFLPRENLGLGPAEISYLPLENSKNNHGILLLAVNKRHGQWAFNLFFFLLTYKLCLYYRTTL